MISKPTYAGLFVVTLATLMYEILLTRIFSVTMWYHYAFMAVSIALFGMTVGALLVYLFPGAFPSDRTNYYLGLSALLFAVSILPSFLTHLSVPFVPISLVSALRSIGLTYAATSVPFVLSGMCVSLALTRFPGQVSNLYAADLAGAAFGCILLVYVLRITDGPTAVIVVALLASVGAVCFLVGANCGRFKRLAIACTLLFAAATVLHMVLVEKQAPLLRLIWVKGAREERPLYEKWNSFSRIRVIGNPNAPAAPAGWGLSSTFRSQPGGVRPVRNLWLDIDASAATVLTKFDGDLSAFDYLKYDVTNVAYYLKRDGRVLVIGTGGGRDILSALVFGEASVVGVEINENIIAAVNGRFGDFTGHLDRRPNITFVVDEARSYVARSHNTFDIIQISLTDTWAATAAGAFVLTENALYTVEAWKLFLDHLTPHGLLTVSRWYFLTRPSEIYRLTSLATAALQQLGVKDPRKHIMIVRAAPEASAAAPNGLGTILVSKEPFSSLAVDTVESIARRLRFDLMLSPRSTLDPTFATIASGTDPGVFFASFPINIAAPTDDSPFFFHMLRLRDMFHREVWEGREATGFNTAAVIILGMLLMIVVVLTSLCIIIPLFVRTDKVVLRGAWPLTVFFSSIGFGFMLIEISQMQRLIVFLGHPTYGLSVVLFVLLLSSGLGSYSTQAIRSPAGSASAGTRLAVLVAVLVIFGMLTPYAISAFRGSTTVLRILVAVVVLCPLGLFMGMAFPLGMRAAAAKAASLTPWLWGVNGATSVCASVLAVAVALSSSISTTFWVGVACYVLASVAFVWASRGDHVPTPRREALDTVLRSTTQYPT
jgi:hypothetical protein